MPKDQHHHRQVMHYFGLRGLRYAVLGLRRSQCIPLSPSHDGGDHVTSKNSYISQICGILTPLHYKIIKTKRGHASQIIDHHDHFKQYVQCYDCVGGLVCYLIISMKTRIYGI